MMYYRVRDNIALRSWMFVPGACYKKGELPAHPLSEDEMEFLKLCDGAHALSEEDAAPLLHKGYIEPCQKGDRISEWSAYRSIPHRHFPKMNFMITGKCNYNCIHCFNCADLSPLQSEWSYEDALSLLDQAAGAGIHALTITGGEPMLHPQFMDLMRAVYDRNMYVEELNTNGHFITEEVLDEMDAFGCRPMMKISFDGIGCHDWMRNRTGAEKITLDAVALCVKKGFFVMVQMQVNEKTIDTILPTAIKLNELGVKSLRLIRTTEVARWREFAGDACIPLEACFKKMPKLIKKICDAITALPKEEQKLEELIVWQLLTVSISDHSYTIYPVRYPKGTYRDTYAVCQGNRGMIGVEANGDVVPCLQMSGYFLEHGIRLGNLHENTLQELLSDGPYLSMITKNLYQLKKLSEACRICPFYEYCGGGCRALALLYAKEAEGYWGEDPTKCIFFKNGYYRTLCVDMGTMQNRTEVPEEVFARYERDRLGHGDPLEKEKP